MTLNGHKLTAADILHLAGVQNLKSVRDTETEIQNPSRMTFAEEIKAERKRAGLTQEQAGTLLEITGRTIIEWESGKSTPRPYQQEGALALLRRQKSPGNGKTSKGTA